MAVTASSRSAGRYVESPRCLVLDDPFLGLAPGFRARLAPLLRELADAQGVAILAAGQHVRTLLRVAHRGYVLEAGRVLVSGPGPGVDRRPRHPAHAARSREARP